MLSGSRRVLAHAINRDFYHKKVITLTLFTNAKFSKYGVENLIVGNLTGNFF